MKILVMVHLRDEADEAERQTVLSAAVTNELHVADDHVVLLQSSMPMSTPMG
jgi:hypothetical protein